MGKGFLGRTGEVGRGRSDIKEGRMIVNQNELYTCMKLSKTKFNLRKKNHLSTSTDQIPTSYSPL